MAFPVGAVADGMQQLQPPRNGVPSMAPGNLERKLYVGNLDPRVTEPMLHQIFSLGMSGEIILAVKILQQHEPKNFQHSPLNYGFVEFRDHHHAEQALQTLNGRKIYSSEIRVNWAFNSSSSGKEDLSNHYHIFVGDLSPEINDQSLAKHFSVFGSMSDARVMWDPNTGKSRGYGFVAFRDKADAEKAINTMNSEWLGSRPIRVNWANQKTQGQAGRSENSRLSQDAPRLQSDQRYETVLAQTPPYNTTIYVGNITPTTTQNELIPLFSQYGFIVEVRMQAEKGYAFVKLDTHENAALAIVSLNSVNVQGRQLRCSWGKDRVPDSANNGYPMYGYQQQQPMPWFFQAGGPQNLNHPTGATPGPTNPGGAVYDPYGAAMPAQQPYWNQQPAAPHQWSY